VSEDVTFEEPATGHPAVDEVLASLADLAARPAAEHVAVFEAAHDRLRAALSEAGDDQVVATGDTPTGA
jgi:hypothetical protein